MRQYIIIFFIAVVFSGCMSLQPTQWTKHEDRYETFQIDVSSDPSGADVFLNDKYLGKTPLNNVPVVITYDMEDNFFWKVGSAKFPYILKVSKEGYQDGFKQFSYSWEKGYDYPLLATRNYHVNLVPRQIQPVQPAEQQPQPNSGIDWKQVENAFPTQPQQSSVNGQ